MGRENQGLLFYASFRMLMDNFQSSRTFRIGSNIFGIKKTAKQMISNTLYDFFIIINSHP